MPDSLSLIIAALSVVFGIFVAWYFYREQQKTDFNRLERNLQKEFRKLSSSYGKIEKALDVSEAIQVSKEISSLKSMVEGIKADVQQVSKNILEDVRIEQSQIIENMGIDFQKQIEGSQEEFKKALQEEIEEIVSPEMKEKLVTKINDLNLLVLRSHGKYQRESIEESMKSSMSNLGNSILSEIKVVSSKVDQLGLQAEKVTHNLPKLADDS